MMGPQVEERVKALRPGIRVVYMSGYTQKAIVHGGKLDPGVDLVEKPVRPADLARKIREIPDRPR